MKISIYELLGLIKNGKAPNRIIYDNYIWNWTGDDYVTETNVSKEQFLITGMYYTWLTEFLRGEVEIIEEKETKPSEEEIEAFKEQFNVVWNSIKSVLGGVLEALQEIDKEELTKKAINELRGNDES